MSMGRRRKRNREELNLSSEGMWDQWHSSQDTKKSKKEFEPVKNSKNSLKVTGLQRGWKD